MNMVCKIRIIYGKNLLIKSDVLLARGLDVQGQSYHNLVMPTTFYSFPLGVASPDS